MPQMKPMSWLIIFLMSFLMLLLVSMTLQFNFKNIYYFKKKNTNNKKNNMSW